MQGFSKHAYGLCTCMLLAEMNCYRICSDACVQHAHAALLSLAYNSYPQCAVAYVYIYM
jgi:hypothetical protein